MSMLCKINGIPVFYDVEDAKIWGIQYGVSAVHTHEHRGRIGYMAGSNHAHIISIVNGEVKTNNEETLLENWAENTGSQSQQVQQTFETDEDFESDPDIDAIPTSGGY
tara:strand:+ start:309 stop:632 length:324 start_codon:yes stop_codon:yes gene_type:complete